MRGREVRERRGICLASALDVDVVLKSRTSRGDLQLLVMHNLPCGTAQELADHHTWHAL